MQSEHAHNNISHSVAHEPHVSLPENVKEVAFHALRNISGGEQFVKNYFDAKPIKNELPAKRHMNQHMHLGWA